MTVSATKDHITFLLDDKPVTLYSHQISPTTTLLNYLRDHLHRTGTKEGCAEGDCGACTVVIADVEQGQLRFRAVNACIQFIPVLDGKALYTVESLQTRPGKLHPIQQAMVDNHASQCGFCTPGFVMSLFALYKTTPEPSRQHISRSISGNLCRCTGYRPILDAGEAMHRYGQDIADEQLNVINAPANTTIGQDELIKQLNQLNEAQHSLHFRYGNQSFYAPKTIDELALLRAQHPDATILAGGTDIGLWVTKQHRDLDTLIYIGHITELTQIQQTNDHLIIGANATLEQSYQALVEHYPNLQDLYERFASLPIRNAGTLVGNIANGSPIGDTMPALMSLGATITLIQAQDHNEHYNTSQTPSTAQREIALDTFYLGYQQKDLHPGEFVESVKIPLPTNNQYMRSYKISKRFEQDISAVCAAFCITLDDKGIVTKARFAFGGMAAIPQRAMHCESALQGKPWQPDNVAQAMQALDLDFQPLTDMRASDQYRMRVARNLLMKFYIETRSLDDSNALNIYQASEQAGSTQPSGGKA